MSLQESTQAADLYTNIDENCSHQINGLRARLAPEPACGESSLLFKSLQKLATLFLLGSTFLSGIDAQATCMNVNKIGPQGRMEVRSRLLSINEC